MCEFTVAFTEDNRKGFRVRLLRAVRLDDILDSVKGILCKAKEDTCVVFIW